MAGLPCVGVFTTPYSVRPRQLRGNAVELCGAAMENETRAITSRELCTGYVSTVRDGQHWSSSRDLHRRPAHLRAGGLTNLSTQRGRGTVLSSHDPFLTDSGPGLLISAPQGAMRDWSSVPHARRSRWQLGASGALCAHAS
jgi:hypothetical protein